MRRALGRGLSQLLADSDRLSDPSAGSSDVELEEGGSARMRHDSSSGHVREIPVEAIVANPRQPRGRFEEGAISELADSIRQHGIIQPLVVRPTGEGRYELVAGERRLRAARKAGLAVVPVVVRTVDAQQSLEVALIENVQREDISPIECARAYRRLMDEFGATQEQVALKVGKTRAAVANTLRLLKLPDEIQAAIDEGRVSEGHARAILMADGPVRQALLFERIVRESLSVREAERLARGEAALPTVPRPAPDAARAAARRPDPGWAALEEGLRELLGAPVSLERREVGGRLTVEFYSDEDLERILEVVGLSL